MFVHVARSAGKIIGFIACGYEGSYKGLPLYKAQLCVVQKEYRNRKIGYAMKHQLYVEIPYPKFHWNDTSQLANFPVIRNNISDSNSLEKIELIYYRKNPLAAD